MKKQYGILAHPAGHSLSPAMHNAAFQHLGIEADFNFFDIAPEKLEQFFNEQVRNGKIDGLAVSIPYKEQVAQYLDWINPKAQEIGAINTIYWQDNKLCGTNTDEEGFKSALGVFGGTALVLGAGGASRAILSALKGHTVFIWARRIEQAKKLAQEFGFTATGGIIDADLIVNTTPVGMNPNFAQTLVEEDFWRPKHIAYDLVMNPRWTKFLRDAKAGGAKTITGDKMLLAQGMLQFEIWTNQKAPESVMQEALDKNLTK